MNRTRFFAASRRTTCTKATACLTGVLAASVACLTAHAQITSPLDISGHVLWLDAEDFNGDGTIDTGVNGAPLDAWVDKSSGLGVNSVTRTAGAPVMEFDVVNSRNAALFNGGVDKLDTTSLFSVGSDYSVFSVVRGLGHVLSGLNTPATDAVLYRPNDSYRFYSGVTTGNTDLAVGSEAGTTAFRLFGYQINSGATDVGFFQGSRTPLEWNGPATLDGLRIGNLNRSDDLDIGRAEAWNGHIAEVIIYNRGLTSSEANSVGAYLNSKYSLGFTPDPPDVMTEIETGHVTGGSPSTLSPDSEPVVTGRINAALPENGGLAFAQNHIGPGSPRDFRPHRANDGLYADAPEGPPPIQEPWIGGTLNSFIGIKLEQPTTIDRIGFEDQFPDRRNGTLTFEYTLDDLGDVPLHPDLGLDPTAIDAKNWQVLDSFLIQDTVDSRHLYSFAALEDVTGVRVSIQSTAAEFAMSELEVWAVPEPTSGAFLLSGGLLLALARCRSASERNR